MIGIKVAKPGQNINSASPNDYYMDSRYPLLKVHSFGTFSFNVAFGETTIFHNLGYKPFVMVFSQLVDYNFSTGDTIITAEYYQHDWFIEGASVMWWGETRVYNDRIVVRVSNTNVFRGGNVNGFYYIFKDEV